MSTLNGISLCVLIVLALIGWNAYERHDDTVTVTITAAGATEPTSEIKLKKSETHTLPRSKNFEAHTGMTVNQLEANFKRAENVLLAATTINGHREGHFETAWFCFLSGSETRAQIFVVNVDLTTRKVKSTHLLKATGKGKDSVQLDGLGSFQELENYEFIVPDETHAQSDFNGILDRLVDRYSVRKSAA